MKKLSEIPGKNPFKIPENYFEEVNRKIISATTGINEESKKISLYKSLRPYLAIAASVAVLIVAGYFAVRLLSPVKTSTSVSEVLNSDYSETYFDDIDISTLEESAASVDLYDEMPDISNKEIIDYLLLDDIEISDIYDHL
jgi:hypothetical protein